MNDLNPHSSPDSQSVEPEPAKAAAPIAIIGIGCMFPKARDLASYWQNIQDGRDCISETPESHWKPEDYFDADASAPDMTYGRRGGFLDAIDFDPLEFGISPRDMEATDTTQLLGLTVAKEALRDAGYPADEANFDKEKVSVVLGVTGTLEMVIPLGARLGHPIWRRALTDAGVDQATTDDVVKRIGDSYVGWQENSFPGLLGNVAAGRIANRLDLHGTNCVVDAACASSLSAMHLAILELQTGRSDMVVTGGLDTFNDVFMFMCFSKTPALSPTGDSKPFAEDGDGTILGEGLGLVVLKRLEDAERDGDRIYSVIRGIGSSSDGKGDAVYAPSAEGQARALRAAYGAAGVDPRTVELVEGHGTGTKVGDAVEVGGLKKVYGELPDGQAPWCALGSVKSMIGHTKAAAGAAGVIKATMSLYHGTLPPTIKVDQPTPAAAPDTTPFYVNTEKRPWLRNGSPRRAGVSAFGFGGSNFHCVLEEYQGAPETVDWDGRVQILAFSGADRDELGRAAASIASIEDWREVRTRAGEVRAAFDSNAPCRLVVVVEQSKGHADVLAAAQQLLESKTQDRWSSPQGIYFGSGPKGKVAAIFPGQGAQYPNMLRDLACQFPIVRETLGAANEAFGPGRRLGNLIYPHAAFDGESRDEQQRALRSTDVAQPAIGAVSIAALRVLESFGFTFDAAAGHSYGELTALYAAGNLDDRSFGELSRLRGQLMAEGDGDRGSMLAVIANREEIDAFVDEHGLDLVVANRNAPTQMVLSGATAEIERAEAALDAAEISSKRLTVAAAFHSPFVAEAAVPFGAAVTRAGLDAGAVPVFSNTTGEVYPAEAGAAQELLGQQLAKPVEFVSLVENLAEAGVTTFVEVGPSRQLSGLVKKILRGRPVTVAAIDASRGAHSGQRDLARTLAEVSAAGHTLDLAKWDEDAPRYEAKTGKKRLTIPVSGANLFQAKHSPKTVRQIQKTQNTPQPQQVQRTPQPMTPTAPVTTTTPGPMTVSRKAADASAPSTTLDALLRLQEQTANIHRQFLEGQARTMESIQALLTGTPVSNGAPTVSNGAPAIRDMAPAMSAPAQASPPPAPQPPQTSAPVAAAPSVNVDVDVAGTLLAIVAEKTGYPTEMLELSMGLDADLGIDSIKRVEILASLQKQLPTAPVIKPEHLGELQTLEDIVAFLSAGMPQSTQSTQDTQDTQGTTDIAGILLAIVAEKTGYPTEMLELSMGLDADLGIDSIKRVEILASLQKQLPTAPVIKPEHLGELQTLEDIVAFLSAGMAAAPVTAAPSVNVDVDVAGTLLAIVAEKTGYPTEMLELSMGLDADLGIDSIKRVEILASLQKQLPTAPVIKPEHLGELQTLEDIVAFLSAGMIAMAPGTAPTTTQPSADAAPEPRRGRGAVQRHVLRLAPVGEPTSSRLALPAGSPVWITRDEAGLGEELQRTLTAQGFAAELVDLGPSDGALAVPEDLAGLFLIADAALTDESLKALFALAQKAGAKLARQEAAVFATVSRLDGAFGLDAPTSLVTSGGLAGLAKTAHFEWNRATCKAFDVDAGLSDDAATCTRIVSHAWGTEAVEIGLSADRTVTPVLEGQALHLDSELSEGGKKAPRFTDRDVVVVSGGARGVTAEIAVALAAEGQPHLALFGRSPLPESEPAWLVAATDQAAIQKALLENAKLQGNAASKMTPVELRTECRRVLANREIRTNLARIETAGSRVSYHAVDVRDGAAVASAVQAVRGEFGAITGLVHGAGVLADSTIADKTAGDFDRVYGTKVEGLEALLAATSDDALGGIVLFSSSTARFGRKGQVDYAMANEVLNKIAQREARERPNARVLSVNWGPWDGGMVTPELRQLFTTEGIEVIGLDAGAQYLLRELAADSGPVEVVILGEGSALPQTGLGTAAPSTPRAPVTPPHRAPRAASKVLPELPKVFERTLDFETHSFLSSHVLDGKAVLPVAMVIEWLGHGALHGNPGLRFQGFEDLRIFKGLIIAASDKVTVRVGADRAKKAGKEYRVAVELCSGGGNGHRVLHARATIVLGAGAPALASRATAPAVRPYSVSLDDVYRKHLFHGPAFQGLDSIEGVSEQGIIAASHLAPAPREWITAPPRSHWLADPLAIDCAFQMMILWSLDRDGTPSLPTEAKSYRQFRSAFPSEGTRIEVRVTEHDAHRATADIDWVSPDGELIARMIGYECVIDRSLIEPFRDNTLTVTAAARR